MGDDGPVTKADIKSLGRSLNDIKEDTRRIDQILTGGTEPDKGLVVKVDRNSRSVSGILWFVAIVVVPVVAYIAVEIIRKI